MSDETSNHGSPLGNLPRDERERRNRAVLWSFALVCAVVLCVVFALPAALIPPAMDQLFTLASFGAALIALFWREPFFASHLTHWDKSLALMGLGTAAGLLTDPVQVEQALEQLGLEAGTNGAATPDRSAVDAPLLNAVTR